MSARVRLHRLWRALFRIEVWNIGIARVSPEELVTDGALGNIRWASLTPNPRLRADPVFWQAPDGLRILYEELPLLAGRAVICSIPVAELEGGQAARVEIERPFHLSYPQLVEEDGVTYCVPEAACSRGVDMYPLDARRQRFGAPLRIIEDVPLIDPTFLRHDGHWYLFGTLRGDTIATHLHIWHARTLKGPWEPHPASPQVSDECAARGAGPFLSVGGRLYRPSQAGHAGYGSELRINQVIRLDARGYEEREVSRLRPDPDGPYPDGLHTLAVADGVAVIDGKRYEWHPLAALSKILWQLRSGYRPGSSGRKSSG